MSRLVFVISLMALVSCGFKSNPTVDSKNGAGIIGGTLVAEKAPIASGIVSVYDVADNAICTGSIIAENFILTAAHCVQTKTSKLKIVFGLDVDATMAIREPDVQQVYVRRVLDIKVHPSYKPEEQEYKQTDWGDIAIIKFSGTLPPGYKPATLLPDSSVLRRGVMVTVAGYGVSLVDAAPVDPKKIRHLEEAMAYGEVICDDGLKNCLKVDMSGDGELRQAKAPISSVQESEVRLDESKGQGTCSGDSGGPAYIEKDGQYYLFGVTSRGSPLCDDVGVYTNAVYYKNWIAETILKMK